MCFAPAALFSGALHQLSSALGIAALAVAATLLGSCTTFDREFSCTASTECVRDGVEGSCVSPGYCAFSDERCTSGLRWDSTAQGSNVDQCVNPGSVDDFNACGGLSILATEPGVSCGLCASGTTMCSGKENVSCEGEVTLESTITAEGSVIASTEFSSDFLAAKGADLNETTSWFSTGPDGVPTDYTWTGTRDDCFTHIKVVGNGGNSNSNFKTGYGFGEATVQVLSEADEVLFSQSVDLSGSPDPTIDLDPNVVGRKIRLLFSGHESDNCGGFGELYVTATR